MKPSMGNLESNLTGWLFYLKRQLFPYRPRFRDWRFWAVQVFVLLVAIVHSLLEWVEYSPGKVDIPTLIPISFFFVPVVYAALNFGFAGSIATAIWCAILSVPNIAWLHPGTDRFAETFQLGIVIAVAIFVGHRVDREMGARRRAEEASAALRASESKYRGLFDSSPIPVLVLNPEGIVLDANPASGALFIRTTEELIGTTISALVGTSEAKKILDHSAGDISKDIHLDFKSKDGGQVYLEPTLTRISNHQGNPVFQVLLRDITEELHRRAGLKAYTAHILRAQEDERKRIAQELHDDTVQGLILLCRKLDSLESAGETLPPVVLDELNEARRTAEETVRDLRDFAKALRPPILDDLGLVTSIRRTLEDLSEQTVINAKLQVKGEETRLSSDIELGLFRIAQEALRNVERHAQASQVNLVVSFSNSEVILDVKDNGVGFNLPTGARDIVASSHLGLLGMKERTELLLGEFQIESSPKMGTRVTVRVPI